jgi:anti-sigma regulatory factor (Ser/Thr protein kinase)
VIQCSYAQDDRSAARQARAAVAELADVDERVRQDLMIVVSELVANAVRHPRPVPGGEVSVSVSREGDAIRVEVRDPGRGFDPVPKATHEGGLGLVIVDGISLDWGVTVDRATTVWCRLATAR